MRTALLKMQVFNYVRGTVDEESQNCPKRNVKSKDFTSEEDQTDGIVWSNNIPRSIPGVMTKAKSDYGKTYTRDEIISEIMIVVTAGYQSVTITCSLFLILLGIHKDVQDEISRELDEVFGDDDRPIRSEDVNRLEKLDRAMKETLRLFSGVVSIQRELEKDVKLDSGIVLPAGAHVVINTHSVHRNERYFPEPERFLPDRWLCSDLHPFAFLAFGGGTRDCMGRKFAILEMKLFVIAVLRRFRVDTPLTMEDLKNVSGITFLRLNQKYLLKIYKK